MTEPDAYFRSQRCPSCGAEVSPVERFCEACGAALEPSAATAEPASAEPESPIELSQPLSAQPERPAAPGTEPTVPVVRPCLACGGVVGPDGYCETCGTKAPSERDHYIEQPAGWVAACCDRGIRHHRNEDATAVAATSEPGVRAVLVVCDGVSTSDSSDVASLAAARAARDVLLASQPAGLGVLPSRVAALEAAMTTAAERANAAVVATTASDTVNAASCTFSAVVLEGDLLVHGNVGDSRSYWIPDPGAGEPLLLSTDDSVAQLRIASGVPREEAEVGPQAHAITKWLGRDTPDHTPSTGSVLLPTPGWVLVCSDGLWNYASEPDELQALVTELSATAAGAPLPLARALVGWANAQGGKDNISVALARFDEVQPLA